MEKQQEISFVRKAGNTTTSFLRPLGVFAICFVLTLSMALIVSSSQQQQIQSHFLIFSLGAGLSALVALLAFLIRETSRAISESKDQLRTVSDALPVLIGRVDANETFTFANHIYFNWFGLSPEQIPGMKIQDVLGPEVYQIQYPYIQKALQEGEEVTFEHSLPHRDKSRYVKGSYYPERDHTGKISGMVILVQDITAQKESAQKLQEEKKALEISLNLGLSLLKIRNLKELSQHITEAAKELIGAEFGGFFYKESHDSQSHLSLYSLSGLSEQNFLNVSLPEQTHIFQEILNNQGVIRINDINDSSFYDQLAPYFGLSLGHPSIKSFIACPVVTGSGEVIGNLFYGHTQKGSFTQRAEQLLTGIAAQAAIAMDNARLYQATLKSEHRHRQWAQHSSLMASAGQVLVSSLNYKEVLQKLAQFLSDSLSAYSSIRLFEPRKKPFIVNGQYSNGMEGFLQDTELIDYVTENGNTYFDLKNSKTLPSKNNSLIRNSVLLGLRKYDFSSVVCKRFRLHDGTYGVITLLSKGDDHLLADFVELIGEITRRTGTAVENSKLFKEAQQANRLKDEFLATISHELRTPLNVIFGYSELLSQYKLEEEVDLAIRAIYRSAKSQAQIIEDLLDVSAIITGKLNLDNQSLDLGEIATHTINGLKLAAQSKNIKIDFAPTGPVNIVGDPTRLQQVIWNLLTNAIKFTPRDGHILIALSTKDDRCHLNVKDTGKGIEPHFLPHIFDRFSQEDSGTNRRYSGLGLGLAIVKQIVELHGGEVHVKSEGKDKGTEFIVSLPLLKERDNRPISFSPQKTEEEFSDNFDFQQYDLTGRRFLVVDDEREALQMICRILNLAGAKCKGATSADEALILLQEEEFDGLISDIGMPGKDGISLIQEIRSSKFLPRKKLPAMAFTAYAREQDEKRAKDNGFQLYLTKPISPHRLVKAAYYLLHQNPGTVDSEFKFASP